MAYKHLPSTLPITLRAAGLKVVEISGWHGRGRPSSTGGFDPVGVLCHHTGSYDSMTDATNDLAYAKWLAITGRSDLPAPLCNIALSAEGVVYVCASGRANHAGRAKASGTVAAGDGNELYIGIEAMNSGSQGWSKAQYNAYVTLCAVLSVKVTGNSVKTVRGHKETSVTGKWDPGQLDMAEFRTDVAAKMKALTTPPPPPPAPTPDPTLKVMTWNVKTNRSWTGAVLPELLPILETHKPDVVCLQECYDAPDLVGMIPGYTFRYQGYGYPPKTEGYIEERSEQIILVRDGVEVKVKAALEMVIPWKGPVVGAWHDPRVHRRVTVFKDGVNWRVIDFHGPFGDALGESNAAMLNCLKTFPADEPVIIVGDWNQSNSAVVTRVGAPGGAVVDGGGIDLAVFRDCRKVSSANLGNFGSDHPVKLWRFGA
jgi:endonuclease/exonuclease/phosphatase family metal-dependent hydrolase